MAASGKRQGAGRPPGSRNKATKAEKATLSELAKADAPAAFAALRRIAENGQSEAAAVTAAIAILDRAYGRPRPVEPAPEAEDSLTRFLHEISAHGSSAPIRPEPAEEDEIEP